MTGGDESLSVLVTQGRNKQSLALTRALGRRGHSVTVAASTRLARSFASNYCDRRVVYPSPETAPEAFVETLVHAVEDGSVDLLVPCGQATVVPVASALDDLSRHATVPVVDRETLERAHDKQRTVELARTLDVPVPETHCPSTTAELSTLAERVDYPVVVKLRKGVGGVGLRYATTPDELLAAYREDGPTNEIFDYRRPLVQEYVPGTIHDVNLLFDHGEVRGALVQQRLLCSPPSGGIGVVDETVTDPDLVDLAVRLLGPLDWHGIAQVEFVVDDRDGSPKLMEINPRIWGTFELSVAAGLDFPGLLCDLVTDDPVDPAFDYRSGKRFVWIDTPMATSFVRSGTPLTRAATILRFLADGAETNLSLDDPSPHLARGVHAGVLGARVLSSRLLGDGSPA